MSLLIRENFPLASLTTLQVGGTARFFVEAVSLREISEAVLFAAENSAPLFILGGGSNVLISDKGFDGLVLKISLAGISFIREGDNILAEAQAGENWDEFVKVCVGNDLQGVECLSGIPGTVGGTPVQNVGAYGQEVSETIVSVRVFERRSQRIFEMSNTDCKFAYRTSIFNTGKKNQFIVLSVIFRLKSGGEPKILYKDLQQFFNGKKPNLKETRDAVLQIRRSKSMVIDADDANSKSAGSFFKNPIVTVSQFAEIEKLAKKQHLEKVPKFEIDGRNVKIPAAWLIENSGFEKGFKFGKAGLSTRHTLALVNLGEARAQDILDLKNEIRKRVREKFNVLLQTEPILVGFEES